MADNASMPEVLPAPGTLAPPTTSAEERLYFASQKQLIWRRFRRHKLAYISLWLLIVMYVVALTFEFWAQYVTQTKHSV